MEWTKSEVELLKSSMTNEDIAEITGRSEKAVGAARYRVTGHKVEPEKWGPKLQRKDDIAIMKAEQITKEARLLTLCKRLGVRIGGMR